MHFVKVAGIMPTCRFLKARAIYLKFNALNDFYLYVFTILDLRVNIAKLFNIFEK